MFQEIVSFNAPEKKKAFLQYFDKQNKNFIMKNVLILYYFCIYFKKQCKNQDNPLHFVPTNCKFMENDKSLDSLVKK